jgi:hypothetical protein
MIETSKPVKEWTILGYLAGDNNLDGAAVEDINEMEVVGSTDQVNVVVQVDRSADYNLNDDNWRSTRRFYITKGLDRRKITSELLKDLGPTNTGDSRFVDDFIRETVSDYPAQRYMLVLWNHGSGFYVPPEMLAGEEAPSGRELTARARPKLKRSFFHVTRSQVLSLPPPQRGICYDDGSQDCLDNKELKNVIAYMQKCIGDRKVDVIGMDACLMTMLEVAYQIRDHALVLVGSEEVEPGEGWPYDRILGELARSPQMSGVALSKTIVNQYIDSYDRGAPFSPSVTQAAVDLSKLGDITQAVDDLATQLLSKLKNDQTQSAIYRAWKSTTRFYDNLYMDLYQFADNLGRISDDTQIQHACTVIKRIFEGKEADSPLIAERHLGENLRDVRGLSIYMPPFKNPSDFYRDLDFANQTRWADFLSAYFQ